MDIGFRIKKINDLMEKQVNAMLEELGLTFSQHHVLIYLIHHDKEPVSLKELEKHFRVAQATMAGIAVRLEAKGFVVSRTDPADRRVKRLTLTELGREACAVSRRHMKEREEALKGVLSEDEYSCFVSCLDRIYEAMKQNAGGDDECWKH